MKDELANVKLIKSNNIIVNFAKEGHEGTHFVALVIRDGNAFYFDSFGCYPLDEVVSYCKHHHLKLGYNSYIVQNIESTNCGLFCFALFKYLGNTMSSLYKNCNEFVDMFDDDTKHNDNILFKYFNNSNVIL